MALVSEWFHDFAADHIRRCPDRQWPDMFDDVFWGPWMKSLAKDGVTLDEATEASERMAAMHIPVIKSHLSILLKVAQEVIRERAPNPKADTSSQERARLASVDCADCSGSGWATRYAHEGDDLRTKAGNPIPPGGSFTLPCSCYLGLYLAKSNGIATNVSLHPGLRIAYVAWSPDSDNLRRYRSAAEAHAHGSEMFDNLHREPIEALVAMIPRLAARFRVETEPAPQSQTAGVASMQPRPPENTDQATRPRP